jgi:hypothetical protein
VADSRYEHAKALHGQGRVAEASAILADLLADDPGNVGARYAQAISLVDLGRRAEAIEHFRGVLSLLPAHYEAAYRLGCLLQDAGEPIQAAEAFRRVLAVQDFRDAASRLRDCEAATRASAAIAAPNLADRDQWPVGGNPVNPGPAPVRRMIETSHVADPGKLVMTTRLKARHLVPLKSFLFAFLGAVVYVTQPLHLGVTGSLPFLLIGLVSLVNLLLSPVTIPVRSRMNSAKLYEYGMDVSTGVLRRSKQFVWYYQITEPPTYVRGLRSYLVHTASLRVTYNNTASTTAQVELTGIGTPQQVEGVRAYLQSRIPPERLPIRGPWT